MRATLHCLNGDLGMLQDEKRIYHISEDREVDRDEFKFCQIVGSRVGIWGKRVGGHSEDMSGECPRPALHEGRDAPSSSAASRSSAATPPSAGDSSPTAVAAPARSPTLSSHSEILGRGPFPHPPDASQRRLPRPQVAGAHPAAPTGYCRRPGNAHAVSSRKRCQTPRDSKTCRTRNCGIISGGNALTISPGTISRTGSDPAVRAL